MLDLVHDIAGSYRQLVVAMSYPGQVYEIQEHLDKMDLNLAFSKGLAGLMYMLIDGEVTFHVVGDDTGEVSDQIQKLTYGRRGEIEEARYIFVLGQAPDEEKRRALEKAHRGDLVDPHLSATLICEVNELEKGQAYELSGPGIEEVTEIHLEFFPDWQVLRQTVNREFPLGVDMIFIDQKLRLMALPRTTQMKARD